MSASEIEWEIPELHRPSVKKIEDISVSEFSFLWNGIASHCPKPWTGGIFEEDGWKQIGIFEQPPATKLTDQRVSALGQPISEFLPLATSRGVYLVGRSKMSQQIQVIVATDSDFESLCGFWKSHRWKIEPTESPGSVKLERDDIRLIASYWHESPVMMPEVVTGSRNPVAGFVKFLVIKEAGASPCQ